LHTTLEQEQPTQGDGGAARCHAHDVNRHINEDTREDPPLFSIASQNMVAAALLLRAMLEPLTSKGRRVREGGSMGSWSMS